MQTQKKQDGIKQAGWIIIFILAANTVIAQPSVSSNSNPAAKLLVQLSITPHTESFRANVSREDSASMKFRIWFANPEEAEVTINITSQTGTYFFSKKITDAWYAETYNFSDVEDGIYIIKITKGKERFRKKILISTDTYTMRTTKVY